MTTIIGIGLACLDFLLQVPALETVNRGCDLAGYKTQGGGMAATALVAVARLGGQAELWTALGQDEYASHIEGGLLAEGVDLEQAIYLPNCPNHVAFVLIDEQSGERVFLKANTAREFRFWEFETEPDWGRIAGADVVLVDGLWNNLCYKGVQVARQYGVPTVGDIEYLDGNERLLPYIDYLVVPEEMALEVAGSADEGALHKLAEYGARMVVITRGPHGSLFLVEGQVGETPAFAVDAVDTTGAGDVFHGAFALGLARGWSPEQIVLFSSAAAAIKCTQLGGRTGIPTMIQTRSFLTERLPGQNLSWLD